METQNPNLAELERDAAQLVEQLAALKHEVQSYKAASDYLNNTATKLAGFLDRTETLSNKSHFLIETATKLLSSGIYDDLAAVKASVEQNTANFAAFKTNLTYFLSGVVLLQVVLLIILLFGK